MYYGPNEILKQMPLGEKLTRLELKPLKEGDPVKTVEISSLVEKEAVTEQPIDLTELRNKRVGVAAKAILGQILDHNLKVDELEYLFTLVVTSFNANMDAATDKLWGANRQERTVQMVDNVLRNGKHDTGTA